jgi:hypothetical protein
MPPDWQGWLTCRPAEPCSYSFQGVVKHFLDCLDNIAKPRVTAVDAMATLDVLLRLYEQQT